MSVLEHHVLRFKEILGAGTIMGDFFCWALVFVILTFFKEGIGNNLTMPSGSWVLVLDSWKWVLGLGSGTCGTGKGPF